MSPEGGNPGAVMRIDRLLVYLRLARTRSAADALIAARAVRCNRQHVLRGAQPVRIGDVLTLAIAGEVRVIELTALPARRGPPAEARAHYRAIDLIHEVDRDSLDPKGQMTITASPLAGSTAPDDPADAL